MRLSFLASRAPVAQQALADLTAQYGQIDAQSADLIVALGGDGFMLDVLHDQSLHGLPVYGLNCGTIGFMMNEFSHDGLLDRIALAMARPQIIHPLKAISTTSDGEEVTSFAINEVSILRQGAQAAHLNIEINGRTTMERLMCDGVLLATPAGSTAYNSSAGGPILPIGANVLAVTPIAAFRPRRWRGAVVPDSSQVVFTSTDAEKRPVMVNADSEGTRDVVRVAVSQDRTRSHCLLFDPDHGLEERILNEQFM
jgi:NAD+ kinase